mmetsp:Transcript_17811/g.21783  ORF Transcript_17811/g.21783 Transcript_17811/m.21783 type:complete len:128 (-) Transcript_17811:638-1021(-)
MIVAATPRGAQKGTTFSTIRGVNRPRLNPIISGSNESEATDFSTSKPFTDTEQPSNHLIKRGVVSTPSTVVENVQITESATSPPASKVNRFDACPPLTEPSNTMPAVSEVLYDSTFATLHANNGIIP